MAKPASDADYCVSNAALGRFPLIGEIDQNGIVLANLPAGQTQRKVALAVTVMAC